MIKRASFMGLLFEEVYEFNSDQQDRGDHTTKQQRCYFGDLDGRAFQNLDHRFDFSSRASSVARNRISLSFVASSNLLL